VTIIGKIGFAQNFPAPGRLDIVGLENGKHTQAGYQISFKQNIEI
jgi:hypothetical protein